MRTSPRLTYFGLRGRAEAIRLLLHATETEFDDHRVESAEEWAALKPTLPFGGLPVYESDGLRLSQSHAILRHLGRTPTAGTAGETHAVELDTTQEVLAEAQEDYWRFAWVQNYYEHLEMYAEETLTPRLRNLARWFPIVFGMGCMGPKIDPRIPLAPGQTFASPWLDPLDLAAFLPNQRRLLRA